ncbi:acyltransferase family protein [Bacteroides sp. An19]|uniref:acyltransferase family protein n=1 Tax=Bacteroides sp. An19 TaxID=1965580 RepID=UPI000B365C35|nr:acyltransferase family protein [Bacteroides sp. An19]OUP37346.1 hypothetical protein B5F25_00735 [Bacteroides sp. An19]
MEQIKQQKRIAYLDNVAGLFIIYMIFMHCCQFTEMTGTIFYRVLSVVFSCFMAWFFFKSGMFHKENTSVKTAFSHILKKLWKPFFFFWCIGFIVNAFILFLDDDGNWVHYILSPFKQTVWDGGTNAGELSMWFLVTLFIVHTLSPIVLKSCKGYGWIVCGAIGCVVSVVNGQLGYGFLHPYYLFNFFPAMFFYGLGVCMRERQFSNKYFAASLVVYIMSFIVSSRVDFRTNTLVSGNLPLWYIYALAGILLFNYVFHKMNRNLSFLSSVGRDSMYWFLLHWPVLMIVQKMSVRYFSLSGGVLLIIVFILVNIILLMLRPLFKYTALNKFI